MDFPKKIGHGFWFMHDLPFTYLKSVAAKEHRRLMVFSFKGTSCVDPGCDRVGTKVLVGKDNGNGIHIDVYTDDFHLMTVDHTQPISRGGSDDLDNKEPMCSKCNSKKGNAWKGIPSAQNMAPDPNSKRSKRKIANALKTKFSNTQWTAMTGEEIDADRCKAYLYMDEKPRKTAGYTHTYVNKLGNITKCYVEKRRGDHFVVTNENGAGVYLKITNTKKL
jgi:hypothetical protein